MEAANRVGLSMPSSSTGGIKDDDEYDDGTDLTLESDDVGSDDGEWEEMDDEYVPRADDLVYLSDLADQVNQSGTSLGDDEEENDPDLRNDPIFKVNLKEYLRDFFRNCVGNDLNGFSELCQGYLNEGEVSKIKRVVG